MRGYISLSQAIAKHGIAILAELADGARRAVGIENGDDLPTEIPREHFAITHEHQEPTQWLIDVGNPDSEWTPTYQAPWLDLIDSTIYTAAGIRRWTDIQVEIGEPTARIQLPKIDGGTLKKDAANWALMRLYEEHGYPAKASMQQITNAVNTELNKSTTPPKFQTKVSISTVQRQLGRRS